MDDQQETGVVSQAKQKLAAIRQAWPELVEADRQLNAGLEIELISAVGYAERNGVTPEQYILGILRTERDRRQKLDAASSNNAMIDGLRAEARTAGAEFLSYVAAKYGGRADPEKLSADFLVRVIRRLEEKMNEDEC